MGPRRGAALRTHRARRRPSLYVASTSVTQPPAVVESCARSGPSQSPDPAARQLILTVTSRLWIVGPCGYDHVSRTDPLDGNRTLESKYPFGLVIGTVSMTLNAP